jgi:hypothetical protein
MGLPLKKVLPMSDDDCDGYAWSTVAMAGVVGFVTLGALVVCGNHMVKNGFKIAFPWGGHWAVRGDGERSPRTPRAGKVDAPVSEIQLSLPEEK